MIKFSIKEIRSMITAIRSEDKSERLHALSNIHIIGQVLGQIRTRNELIPYIMETTDHDEIALKEIAKELGNMFNEVGGVDEIQCLISALKTLCESEDAKVRKAVISSLIQLSEKLTNDEFEQKFSGVLIECCNDNWYPLRCAGAALVCQLFDRIISLKNEEIKNKLKCLLEILSHDKCILVRKSLITNIDNLIKIDDPEVKAYIERLLCIFGKDSAPAVMIEIPEILCKLKEGEKVKLEISKKIFDSSVWQAKAVLLNYINIIFVNNFAPDFIKKAVNDAIHDDVCAVRASVTNQLPFIHECKCFDENEFQQIILILMNDNETDVRQSLAESLGNIKFETADFMERVLTQLLSDEKIEVKLAALKSVSICGIAVKFASQKLSELIKFSSWRVKKSIIEIVPKIASTISNKSFDEYIFPVVKLLLFDDANDVRVSTIKALSELIQHFGEEWKKDNIIPLIKELFISDDYQLRKTAVSSIVRLQLIEQMNDTIEQASIDTISNVRLVLAKELPRTSPMLNILKQDSDKDVVYFATQK